MNVNDIKCITVVGAGTMGHSIAQVYAQSGIEVDLVDLKQDVLERASSLIILNLNTLAEFGRVSRELISSILDKISYSTDLESAANKADLVVEAVHERPETKKTIFSQLEKFCSEDTIFASNTSGLDIFRIAKIKNPERLIIHHWFAPPHIIPLVEIVQGRKTSTEVIEISMKLMEKLGKKPILIKKFVRSFIVNKIQNAMGGAMYELLTRGITTPEEIDIAIKSSLGIRLPIVGVAQSQDFTGLDLVLDVQKSLGIDIPIVQQKVENGHLGVKSSKGFYEYGDRSEEEILQKRDRLYLQMLDFLEKQNAYERI